MSGSQNIKLIEQFQAISESEGVIFSSDQTERLNKWNVGDLKKVWEQGTLKETGQEVSVILRPLGSKTDLAEFIRTEKVSSQISVELNRTGIKTHRTIKSNLNSVPEWIIREFIPGKPIGYMSYSKEVNSDLLFDFFKKLRDSLDEIAPKIDSSLLNNFNWKDKWLGEFRERSKYIKEHLDDKINLQLLRNIESVTKFTETTILHNDLAPQNILATENKNCSIIDWGEAAVGNRVIDIAMCWVFAVHQDTLREQLLELAMDTEDVEESKSIFLAIASRMMASFAEWLTYYRGNPQENPKFIKEIEAAFPKYWDNLKELQVQLLHVN